MIENEEPKWLLKSWSDIYSVKIIFIVKESNK